MNNTDQVRMLLSMLTMQLPLLAVCLVALVVILVKWKEAPRGALWAFLGFCLALILCTVMPIVQSVVQRWVMQHDDVAHRAPILSGLSILWSLLRAASYALLLVAVFAGRSMPPAASPPA
jgi:hypothetical protein